MHALLANERFCQALRMTCTVRLSPAGGYLMWAVTAHRDHFPVPDARLGELDPAGLHGIAARMIRSWHPDLRGLLGLADLDQTFLVRTRTSVPRPAWQPSRVTLLGDAIHAMSPARGSGANTALQECRPAVPDADRCRAGRPGAGSSHRPVRDTDAPVRLRRRASLPAGRGCYGRQAQWPEVLAAPPPGQQPRQHRLTCPRRPGLWDNGDRPAAHAYQVDREGADEPVAGLG